MFREQLMLARVLFYELAGLQKITNLHKMYQNIILAKWLH